MAGPLASVERFFERLFERPAARLFHAAVEPTQIRRSIERVIEGERRTRAGRVYVPGSFRVLLNRTDLEAIAPERAALSRQLAEDIRTYARAHGYVLPARPAVAIEASPVLAPGDVKVFAEGEARPADLQEGSPLASADTLDGGPLEPSLTSVFPIPRPNVPRAWLAARSPGRPVTRIAVRPGTLRIGRSVDNDVVLIDDRVSRHHGQVAVRLGMLVYTDLASTNGSFVNGGAVTEIALGPGDELQLGSSTVTIEPAS